MDYWQKHDGHVVRWLGRSPSEMVGDWERVKSDPHSHGLSQEQANRMAAFFTGATDDAVESAAEKAHYADVWHLDEKIAELQEELKAKKAKLSAQDGPAASEPPTSSAITLPAPASEPAAVNPTGKRWTPEALEELREYRTKHGTKAASERFGISDARVRALLPSDNPPPRGYSAFNPRT